MVRLRDLRESGVLHSGLVRRLRIYAFITLALLVLVGYDIAQGALDWRWGLLLGIVGFILGLFVFSRMFTIVWDEKAEAISAGRMDKIGGAVLGLYILFEVGLHTELPRLFPTVVDVTPLLFATVAGSIFGRLAGMVIEILRTYKRHA